MKDFNKYKLTYIKVINCVLFLIYKNLILIILIFFIINTKNKNSQVTNPIISIFLPIYNKSKYLKRSIGSIQKQTLKEIEIIAINDCSEDNSLEILNEMAKKDSRIKIINNNKNKGLLFSRAMGILYSKGEYLMNLDPDDALQNSGNLKYLYRRLKNTKLDLIKFGMVFKKNSKKKRMFKCTNFNKIQYQPQIFKDSCIKEDYLITNKLIKKKILIKAYEFLKQNIYGKKWNYAEDEIWSSLVNKNANSMICVNKIIYIYYINNDSLITNKFNSIFLQNLLYWLEIFKKIFENRIFEKYFINRILILLDLFKYDNFVNIFKKEKELKNNYIKVLQNINMKNSNNYNDILNNIIDFLKNLK